MNVEFVGMVGPSQAKVTGRLARGGGDRTPASPKASTDVSYLSKFSSELRCLHVNFVFMYLKHFKVIKNDETSFRLLLFFRLPPSLQGSSQIYPGTPHLQGKHNHPRLVTMHEDKAK